MHAVMLIFFLYTNYIINVHAGIRSVILGPILKLTLKKQTYLRLADKRYN